MSDYANVVIRASAGTGKTFQLTNRFMGLLHAGAPVDEILATTFTRKAAGEILDRVLQRLAAAALDEEACRELSAQLGGPQISQAECRKLLADLTHNLHRLHVCTLDSFFAQLAGSFSLEAGLPPGWQIVDELEDEQLRSEAIAAILRDEPTVRISRLVNLMTKGDAQRSVSQLVRSTVGRLYDLYMETTADAWQTVSPPAPLSADRQNAAIEQLRDFELSGQLATARDTDLTAAETGQWEELIRKGLAAKILAGETTYKRTDIPAELIERYGPLLRQARSVLMTQLAQQTTATYELLDSFAAVYRRLKTEARALRFGDVTRHLAEADNFDSEQTSFRFDSQITHLLLDEFQDTSPDQWRVLRPFAHRVTARGDQQSFIWSGASSLFCVGDVKQAIYGWRGGNAEIFEQLESELDGLTSDALNQSWRSAPPIIDTVNQLFTNLTKHSELGDYHSAVRKWQNQFAPHTTAKTSLPGYAELVTAPAAEGDAKQTAVTFDYAADRVAELVGRAPAASLGVLVRRNESVAQLIYRLRNMGVAASEEGGNPLTDSAAVEVVLSLLHLADHPGDTVARFHVFQSPLAQIVGLSSADDDGVALRVAEAVRSDLQTMGLGTTVDRWVQKLAEHCNQRDFSRLEQLVEMAFNYNQNRALRTQRFLDLVRRKRIGDPTSANVRVMTVHQAKGLEFDVVVLPELDVDLIGERDTCVVDRPEPTAAPTRVCLYRNAYIRSVLPRDLQALFREQNDQSIREALCWLYVAVTRAAHALHMIIAPSNRGPHRKFSGLVRAALAEGRRAEAETTLFQTGDANWYAQPGAPQPPPMVDSQPSPAPLEIKLRPIDRRRSGLQRTSPSRIARGRYGDVTRIFTDTKTALARGNFIHACFQQIRWLEDGRPGESDLREAVKDLDTGGLDLDQLIAEFQGMLDEPVIAGALSNRVYQPPLDATLARCVPQQFAASPLDAEVRNEQPFAVRDEGRILTGAIDRLVLLRAGGQLVAADVIDFKTDAIDSTDPAAIAELVSHYRPQLDCYRRAVAKTYGLAPGNIATRLLLVAAPALREV